jgi:predicted peptidase
MLRILNLTRLLLVAAVPATVPLLSAQPMTAPASPTNQTAHHFQFEKTIRAQLDYLLFLPQGYDAKAAKRWPLILFLHGAGERGSNPWAVATHGPAKYIRTTPDFPFIVVSPQCPEGQIWSRDVLLGLLDDVIANYPVDTHRVYLTGLSMGGYGTWDLGLAYPERFAAIVPICGGGQTIAVLLAGGKRAAALQSLGVWAFHGAKDPIVPLLESQRMVEAVKRAGLKDVHLTVYPEAQHDSWTETYNNPKLYDWLLTHER